MKHGFYIIWIAATVHMAWAIVMLVTGNASMATPIAPLYDWFGHDTFYVAVWLLGISLLAGVGHHRYKSRIGEWLCIIPQQTLLIISGWSSYYAITHGEFADGYKATWDFILNGEVYNIASCLWHCLYVAFLTSHICCCWLDDRRIACKI